MERNSKNGLSKLASEKKAVKMKRDSHYHTNFKKNINKQNKKNVEKRLFETRIRIEKQSKLSGIVSTTPNSRDATGSAGEAAVVPILPPAGTFLLFALIFVSPFLHMNYWLNSLRHACTRAHKRKNARNRYEKKEMWVKRTENSTILGGNWWLANAKSSSTLPPG